MPLLVAKSRGGRKRAEQRGRVQLDGRARPLSTPIGATVQLAGKVAPLRGEEPRLRADEGDRVRRAHGASPLPFDRPPCRCRCRVRSGRRARARRLSRRCLSALRQAAARRSANTPSSGRVRPMPNMPSTSQRIAVERRGGAVVIVHARRAGRVERPAGVVGFHFDRHAHSTAMPALCSAVARTSASPPLLPGPAISQTVLRFFDRCVASDLLDAESSRPTRPRGPSACARQRSSRRCDSSDSQFGRASAAAAPALRADERRGDWVRSLSWRGSAWLLRCAEAGNRYVSADARACAMCGALQRARHEAGFRCAARAAAYRPGHSGVSPKQVGDQFAGAAREPPARRPCPTLTNRRGVQSRCRSTGNRPATAASRLPKAAPPKPSRAPGIQSCVAWPSSASASFVTASPNGLSILPALCSTAPPAMRSRWFIRADRDPLDRIDDRDVRRAFLMGDRRGQRVQPQRMQRQPQAEPLAAAPGCRCPAATTTASAWITSTSRERAAAPGRGASSTAARGRRDGSPNFAAEHELHAALRVEGLLDAAW